jgi:DNA-binding NarL/FixJ family response regulator
LAIVDDHDLIRESLQNMLSDEPEIVGEAANGRQGLSLCSRSRPDVILMDVRMPVMDGLADTKEVKQRYPEISVMMLTMHENPDYLLGALKAGAGGYVLKDTPHEEVLEAVRRVRNGESPLDLELAVRLLRRLASEGEVRRGTGGPHAAPYAVEPLTPRELEVLRLMKLGVSDRTRAVVQGLELGLIDLP